MPLAEKAPFSKLSAGLLRLQENAFSPVELPLTLNSVKQASECQLEPDHIPLRVCLTAFIGTTHHAHNYCVIETEHKRRLCSRPSLTAAGAAFPTRPDV